MEFGLCRQTNQFEVGLYTFPKRKYVSPDTGVNPKLSHFVRFPHVATIAIQLLAQGSETSFGARSSEIIGRLPPQPVS